MSFLQIGFRSTVVQGSIWSGERRPAARQHCGRDLKMKRSVLVEKYGKAIDEMSGS